MEKEICIICEGEISDEQAWGVSNTVCEKCYEKNDYNKQIAVSDETRMFFISGGKL